MGPDPDAVYPNEKIKSVVFIKNVISRPNIIAGEYSYYDDNTGAEKFEEHVTHHYEFIGDKLIIGKFCAIAKGIEFVMNGANHRMNSVTTYPFNIMGGGWEKFTPSLRDLPLKGDTVVGNDVWIGQNVTVMPGIHIGDGGGKPGLLLQTCCAPCSTTCIERLFPHFKICVFFYNPNIYPFGEYSKRLDAMKRFIELFSLDNCLSDEELYLEAFDYREGEFEEKISLGDSPGLALLPERGGGGGAGGVTVSGLRGLLPLPLKGVLIMFVPPLL